MKPSRNPAALLVLAVGGFVVLGLAFSYLLLRELRDARDLDHRLSAVSPGESVAVVISAAGEPDERCNGSVEVIWPIDGPQSEAQKVRSRLGASTAFTFLYRFRDGKLFDEPGCKPLYNDAILGFTSEGRLLWVVRAAGQSVVEYEPHLLPL